MKIKTWNYYTVLAIILHRNFYFNKSKINVKLNILEKRFLFVLTNELTTYKYLYLHLYWLKHAEQHHCTWNASSQMIIIQYKYREKKTFNSKFEQYITQYGTVIAAGETSPTTSGITGVVVAIFIVTIFSVIVFGVVIVIAICSKKKGGLVLTL